MFSLGNPPWKLWKSYVNENRSRRLGDAMTVTFWAMQNDFGKAGPLKQFDSCSRGEIMGQGSKFLAKEMKENYKHHTWSSLWENLPNTLFCLHQFEDWKPSAFRKKIAKKEECMEKNRTVEMPRIEENNKENYRSTISCDIIHKTIIMHKF